MIKFYFYSCGECVGRYPYLTQKYSIFVFSISYHLLFCSCKNQSDTPKFTMHILLFASITCTRSSGSTHILQFGFSLVFQFVSISLLIFSLFLDLIFLFSLCVYIYIFSLQFRER